MRIAVVISVCSAFSYAAGESYSSERSEQHTQPPSGGCVTPVTIVALLPLQRDALRALLKSETGHLSRAVHLELKEWPPGILKARL